MEIRLTLLSTELFPFCWQHLPLIPQSWRNNIIYECIRHMRSYSHFINKTFYVTEALMVLNKKLLNCQYSYINRTAYSVINISALCTYVYIWAHAHPYECGHKNHHCMVTVSFIIQAILDHVSLLLARALYYRLLRSRRQKPAPIVLFGGLIF